VLLEPLVLQVLLEVEVEEAYLMQPKQLEQLLHLEEHLEV
jgi:hypothetical protein